MQQLVAKELGQIGTRLTPADKAEHMKRQRHPRLRPQSAQSFSPSPGPSADVQLATLAQRVKEVLPHVPLGVIQRDLARTGCVDLTITNLLEGLWLSCLKTSPREPSPFQQLLPQVPQLWLGDTSAHNPNICQVFLGPAGEPAGTQAGTI